MNIPSIYQNIKSFRELKKLTREFVADELGMTVSGYSKIERGEVDITLSRLQRISEVLEVDVARLMSFDVSQVFNFNLQQNALVQAPGSHAQTMHLYGNQIHEKYITMLEKEVERLSVLLNSNQKSISASIHQ